jgi:hypothetical protein
VKELYDNGVECSKMGDEERSSRSSVVSDDLIQREIRHFRISDLLCEFHALFSMRLSQAWISQVLHKMVTNAHRCTQSTENGFGFDFLELYNKDGNEFPNHII